MLRHRWYAGGISALLAGALVFAGMTPAIADEAPTPAPSDTATSQDETTPAPEPTTPAEPTTPPAPEKPTAPETTPPSPDVPSPAPSTNAATPTPSTSPTSPEARSLVAPPAAPLAAATATIKINVGGTRTANSSTAISPLAGSGFQAKPVGGGATLTCTSDAAGVCTISDAVVGTRYDITQTGAPAGWYMNANLDYGGSASGTSTPYSFRTASLPAGVTTVPGTTIGGSYDGDSDGDPFLNPWATSLNNNSMPNVCGLNIAMIMDRSGSMSGAKLANLKSAANNVVTSLIGSGSTPATSTKIALYSFASDATKITGLTSSYSALTSGINSLSASGGTNWDQGLYQAVTNRGSDAYDLVVVLTDGNPTYDRSGNGNQSRTRFDNISNGIFSANAIKSMDNGRGGKTRIVTIGIGVDGGAENIRAISGTALNSDYYLASSSNFGDALYATLLANCSLTVTKQVQGANGSTTPASGWNIKATVGSAAASTKATDSNGKAIFGPLSPGAQTFTVVEQQKPGFAVVPSNGKNLVCTQGGNTLTVTNTGTSEPGGTFTGDISAGGISCTITNTSVSTLTLTKAWTGGSPGDAVSLTATNKTNGAALTTVGTSVNGGATTAASVRVNPGDQVELKETFTTGSAADYNTTLVCNGASVTLTGGVGTFTVPAGTAAGTTLTCTFTNVSNMAKLTLKKQVVSAGGAVDPATAWTLTVGGAAGWVSTTTAIGTDGTLAATAKQSVKSGTPFTLNEVGPTAGYTAGAWTCDSGVKVGTGSTVTLAAGADVTCTIVNTQKPAKLTVLKKGLTGDTLLDGAKFQLSRDTGSGNWQNIGTPVTAAGGSYTWNALGWGTYKIEEVQAPDGYDISTPNAQVVTIGAAETATTKVIEFRNPRSVGSLQITKTIGGAGGVAPGTTFSGTYDCGVGFAGPFAALSPTTPVVISGIPVGSSCTVTEKAPVGGLVDDSYAWDVTGTVNPASVTIVKNQTATLNIKNTTKRVYGSLDVTKALKGMPTGFTGTATFSGTWTCDYPTGTADDTSGTWSVTFVGLVPGTVSYTGPRTQIPLTSTCSITENSPSNGVFGDPSYTWKAPVVSPATVKVTSDAKTASFTVTNEAQRASLTLIKVVKSPNGGTAVAADWNQLLQAKPAAGGAVLFDSGQTKYVAPKAYALTELAGGPAGYALTGIECSVNGGTYAPVTSDVTVPEGGAVVCQFTNTDTAPKLTLVKNVDNKGGVGSANASAWTLSATSTGNPSVTGVSLPATGTTASISGAVKGNAVYTLDETGGPSGYTPGTWACYKTGTKLPFEMQTANTVKALVGTDITCEITNTAIPATATVVKNVKAGWPKQQADGSWEIAYDIVVTNTSATSTYFYSLSDKLSFGAGITPTAAAWTGPTNGTFSTLTGSQVLNPAGSLAPNTSTTYTVTVKATVSATAADAGTSVCTSTSPTRAFRNTTTLTSGGDSTTVDDCAQPWFPMVTKTASAPTQNADGSWNVAYTVTATNPGAGPLQVTLKDAFPAAPSGWSYAPASWAVAAVGTAPAPAASSFAPGTTGTIYTGAVPATTSYAYTVSATLVPSSAATPLGDCAAEGGLRNKASVVSGEVTRDATACVTVTTPPVTVAKTAAATQQLADGTWQIDYTIAVTNTSPTVATVYTLTDVPQLGTGFTVVSGAWGTAPIANTPIAGGATQNYTYRIIASFDATVKDPQLTCTPAETGAFSNKAVVTFPGGTASDLGCSQPGTPTVTKTAQATTQVSATQWKISYTVTVANTSGKTLAYTLSDTPAALPANVTGAGWTATGPTIAGGGSGSLTAGWTGGTGSTQLATGLIPTGATHVYTVSNLVTVGANANPADLACSPTAPTKGFWNNATVTNGVGGDSSDACTSVVPPKVGIVKSDATVAQLADGTWDLSYEVTVTNQSSTAEAAYTLADTPQFDAVFTPVVGPTPWTAEGSTTSVATAEGTLAAGASTTWTYRVSATADASDATPSELEGALRCTTEGETPGGGFYNVATVTFPGGTASDAGCGVPATPTVTKTAAAATYSAAGWQISYTVTVTNGSGIPLAYTATDDPPTTLPTGVTATAWAVSGPADLEGGTATLDPAWSGATGGVFATGTLPAGASHAYTVTATLAIAPTTDLDQLTCSSEGTRTGIWNEASVTNGLGSTDDEACTTFTFSPVSVAKSTSTVQQLTDGNWQIDYLITVTNEGTSAAPYTLTETPKPDASFEIVSQEWVGGTPGAEIAPVGTPVNWTYRVVVKAKTGDAFNEKTATVCTEAEDGKSGSGGFYNTVAVTYLGGSDHADACGVPIKPSVVKTGAAVQDPATGNWTVTYTVKVQNNDPKKIALAYTLSDVAADLPAGATKVTGWTIADPQITGGGSSDTAVANTAWAGSRSLGSGFIGAGAQHTYTVSATYALAATADPADLACQEDGTGGFQNAATVTNGIGSSTDDACVSVTVPTVTLSKTVTSTALQADGRWKITYDVVVTGDDELTATYSLSDTLTFGGDIVVDTAASGWTGPTTGSFGSSTTAQLATDRAIAKNAVDTYTVTAYATIDQAAFTGETLTCDDGRVPEAGGFLNVATVTAAGETTSAHDCSEPSFPKIVKQAQSVVQAADPDQYDVTYLLTVTGGSTPGYYDLSDTPAFAPGLTLISGTATAVTPTPGAPVSVTSGVPFATDVAIGANEVQTWTMTWRVERTSDFDPANTACTEEPGHGLFNTASVTFGSVVQDDADCVPLLPRYYPTVAKTVTSVTQDAGSGIWTITYDVVASLAANAENQKAKYDLTDTLEFGDGITVTSASFSGHKSGTFTDGSATLATGETIAPATSHTYTVTVKATVSAGAIEEGTLSCLRGEGGPEAGGFLNTALLTSGGREAKAFDCAEPQVPTVVKSAATTTDNPDGSQRVSYLVTVTAPAPVDGDPVSNLGYSLTEDPQPLASGLERVGDWHAEAVSPSDLTIDEPTFDGTGEWKLVSGAEFTADEREAGTVTHTYRVWADIEVTELPSEFESCGEGDTGIAVWNRVALTIGDYTTDDRACGSVDWDEVTIEKDADLPGDQTTVQPGDTFDYVLTVRNNGTRAATGVHVTDSDINDRLEIQGLTVSGGVTWTAPGYTGNDVDLTIASLAVGQSVEVRITVEFLPAPTTVEDIVGDAAAPTPAAPIDELTNTACVDSDQDGTLDCDDNTITTRDITATVYTRCVADAPLLGWTVQKSASLASLPIDFLWTPNSGTPTTTPADVSLQAPPSVTTWTNEIRWPGSAFTPSGISIDDPGWRPLRAADYAPGGGFFLPGTSTVMTPAQQAEYVFNGLILDPSELDFAWRGESTVTLSVNPELQFEVAYPPATPECIVPRHTKVEIEKTASTQKAMPGDPFSYTIDVRNVSDDSAADGVVVTDAIPATIKVTNVTWAGKGDDSVFPNWKTCAVTGQSSSGYGGTLTCELFGPLQVAGRDGDTAPQITLASEVSKTAPTGAITNVAIVDYHTFGDPTDAGRDSDDAVILVSLLPATGGTTPIWILWGALAAIVTGTGAVLVIRRRRREAGTL
ncbi:SpaA isopeptide-forming pilin-related protein [Microbacterium sp. bgisy203]|uniref:SpaA isopeptide-forming pilin-related protein n=1 Tax=Microbacterium sp. bgisy203 TaxID=3413799 RepID=UPI003D73A1ED